MVNVTDSMSWQSYQPYEAFSLTAGSGQPRVRGCEDGMQVSSARFVSVLEWTAVAVVLATLAALGSIAAREIRTLNAVTPVIAGETLQDPPVPAGIPSRAVSVPMLQLGDDLMVRVGEGLDTVTLRLGGAAETRPQAVERAPNGERLTRFYEYAGARVVLVFEPFERKGEPRIAAIYLQ
jgi:hypothetical protein